VMRVLTPARWYPLERDGDLGEVTDIAYYRDGPAATPAGTQDGSCGSGATESRREGIKDEGEPSEKDLA
jgi:hypothetical protein